MNLHRKLIGRLVAPAAVVLMLGASTWAASPGIHIDNFGKVDDEYYRGSQPERTDYADLAKLGVKTVVDLQSDGSPREKGLVEQAGMTFYRIPLTTSERPSDAAVKQFLSIVDDPAKQPVYVHCAGGQHRTGVMTAVYRMTKYGWSEDRAYDEMKQYKFETFIGHPELRHFVHDFYSKLTPVASPLVAAAALPSVAEPARVAAN